MPLYAWTQDVPITEPVYREIVRRMGSAPMPGLIAHIALQQPDGSLRYLDIWESEQACDKAFDSVIHPAVGPVLADAGIA